MNSLSPPANEPIEQEVLEIAPTVQDAKQQNSSTCDPIDEAIGRDDELSILTKLQTCELWNHATSLRSPFQSTGSPLQSVECGRRRFRVSFDQVSNDCEEVSCRDLGPVDPIGSRAHREVSRARAVLKASS